MEVPRWFQRRLAQFARDNGKRALNGRAGIVCAWNPRRLRFGILEYNPATGKYQHCFYLENEDTGEARMMDGSMDWVFDILRARDTRKRYASNEQFLARLDAADHAKKHDQEEDDAKFWDEARVEAEKEIHFIHNHEITDGSTEEALGASGVKKDHIHVPSNAPSLSEPAHV